MCAIKIRVDFILIKMCIGFLKRGVDFIPLHIEEKIIDYCYDPFMSISTEYVR